MDYSNRDPIPAELEEVADRLRQGRATATPFELDRIKLQARRQVERPRPSFYARQRGMLMRSRLALVLVVAAGFILSTTGATLAITGSSSSGNAAQGQYEEVGGAHQGGGDNGQTEDGVKGVSLGGDNSTEPASQTSGAGQAAVAGGSGSLPFTGFLAIPLLFIGVGLLSVGAIMHRKTSGRHSAGT